MGNLASRHRTPRRAKERRDDVVSASGDAKNLHGQNETQSQLRTNINNSTSEPSASSTPHRYIPFAFLRLPIEIQELILVSALDQIRTIPRDSRSWTEVRDLLSVSSKVHSLLVPYLYKRIFWYNWLISSSLLRTISARPEYITYVHEVELVTFWRHCVDACHLVGLLTTDLNQQYRRNERIQRLYLSTSSAQLDLAIWSIQNIRPSRLEWQHNATDMEQLLFAAPAFAEVALRTSIDHLRTGPTGRDWLDHLVMLHLTGFRCDEETVNLIARLPSPKSLILSGPTTKSLSPSIIRTVLTTGSTRAKLTAFTICGVDIPQRRVIHRDLGTCILTATGGGYDKQIPRCEMRHGAESKIWHGCQDRSKLTPEGDLQCAHMACPRCCVLWGQTGVEAPPLPSDQLAGRSARRPTDAAVNEHDFRFGLCDEHYDEIFAETSTGDSDQDEANFLRRRIHECMRWHPCEVYAAATEQPTRGYPSRGE